MISLMTRHVAPAQNGVTISATMDDNCTDAQAYSTPPFFRDDWLNQYYDMRSGKPRCMRMVGWPCHAERITWDPRSCVEVMCKVL